nr:hypothetical protein [Bacteroidaceae bacterium]
MKKFLLTLALMSPMAALAQHWTAKTNQEINDGETVVYAQVYINGTPATANDGLELAAFIGDECRADATRLTNLPTSATNVEKVFALRVVGYNTEANSEVGQTVTFRAFYQNVEYQFTKTINFMGEATYTPYPLQLNLDAVTGVSVTNPINVSKPEADFPFTMDLKNDVKPAYGGDATTGSTYKPKGESKILSPITYTWTTNYTDMLVFDNTNNKVQIQKKEGTAEAQVTMTIGEPTPTQQAPSFSATTNFVVAFAAVPVTGITCTINTLDFYAYDDLKAYLQDKVTISPDNASEKDFILTANPTDGYNVQTNYFTMGGKYTITVKPKDETFAGTCPTINVTAYVRPTTMTTTAENNTIEVGIGEDVYAAIENVTKFQWPGNYTPDAYAKKDVTYEFGATDYVDASTHKALKEGSVRVTVKVNKDLNSPLSPSSASQGQNTFTITVNIVSRLDIKVSDGPTVELVKNGGTATLTTITVTDPANEFDKTKLTVDFQSNRYSNFPYATLESVEEATSGSTGNTGETGTKTYNLIVKPQFVTTQTQWYNVKYDGKAKGGGSVNIRMEQALAAGWNWISVVATRGEGRNVNNVFTTKNDIEEIRSQKALLYNDPDWGYFGDITNLTADEATYKVKTNKATVAKWDSVAVIKDGNGVKLSIQKGYNWINNPYEFDIPAGRIAEFLGPEVTATEGDIIITQSGSAHYTADAGWTAVDGFALKEGAGLIYYATGENYSTTYFNANFAPIYEPGGTNGRGIRAKNSMGVDLFQYDIHAFADNMSMVATVEGLENPENYTLGVFVNGECRGRGQVVKDNMMIVSAVGKAGEKMTFKLANNETGEVVDLDDTVTYSLIKGSFKAPVVLSGTTVTGIEKTK